MLSRHLLFLALLFFSFLLSSCAPTLYEQGRASLDKQEYDKAEELLQQELTANPSNAAAIRDLGIVQYKKTNLTEAEKLLSSSYNLEKNAETLLYLGLIAEAGQDYNKAINYYKEYSLLDVNTSTAALIEGRISFVQRQQLEQEIKFALQNEEKLSNEPVPENTVAVLSFQNLGDNKELDPLQKGLTEMLITDLSKISSIKVVERVKLQKLMDEMNLSSGAGFDQSTAPRMGKLMKAGRLIKGSYLNPSKDQIRVDVNLVGTSDGSTSAVKNVTGDIADYFKLQKELAFSIIEKMGIQITDKEREAIQVIPTESFLAFVAYSKGLDLQDKGMLNEAMSSFREATALDPSFKGAELKVNEIESVKSTEEFEGKMNEGIASKNTLDRLVEGAGSLTGEYLKGVDDRNPNATGGFGRSTKVEIIIKR